MYVPWLLRSKVNDKYRKYYVYLNFTHRIIWSCWLVIQCVKLRVTICYTVYKNKFVAITTHWGGGKVFKGLQREIISKKYIYINKSKLWNTGKKGILDVCKRAASYCPQSIQPGDTAKAHHGILWVWPAALVTALLLQPFHSKSHPLKN